MQPLNFGQNCVSVFPLNLIMGKTLTRYKKKKKKKKGWKVIHPTDYFPRGVLMALKAVDMWNVMKYCDVSVMLL